MKQVKWISALLVFCASMVGMQAQTLKVGDPAPKLQVSKWVQGEPVKEFEKGKAYVVEFWATWCGPCRVSIPHLNELHNKFKDKGLVVIGQNVSEEDTSKVAPFVKEMGDKMTYRVALDQVDEENPEKGKMAETWLMAAGIATIPTAFVVDKEGKIAWIGNPMELEDTTIAQVLNGTFDSKTVAASQQALQRLSKELESNFNNKNWDAALTNIAEIDKLLPENKKAGAAMVRVKALLAKGDDKKATELAKKLGDAHKDDVRLQDGLAWMFASEDKKGEGLDLAYKLATRANEVAKGQNPSVLETLARISFLQDKADKAVEFETQAVKLADGELKEALQRNLDSYKEGKLPKLE